MSNSLYSMIAREIAARDKEKKKEAEFPGDKTAVTRHVVKVNGKNIPYKATAGYLKLYDEKRKLKSRIFHIAYEREDAGDKKKRPVTFAFNGGPGASSAWVHFGAMGPKRIKMTEEGFIHPPPYEYMDNEYSWLEFTDLVFIDPVGTGYSSPHEDEELGQFCGVEEDVKWIGDFIRHYISQNDRWLSPKYIAGESYGTFRAAALVSKLQLSYAMDFNGLIFISSALHYLTFAFGTGNDLPYLLFLPGYTATAWYHGKLDKELQEKELREILKEVEEWVLNEYSVALFKGDALPGEEREKIIDKLAKYTTLPKEYIDECNLRIKSSQFRKKLLRKEKQTLGVYDARLKSYDLNPTEDNIQTDASMYNIFGSCIATLHEYLKKELKYDNELLYKPLSRDVSKVWNWGSGIDGMGYINVTEETTQAMNYNKYLNVFFAHGYYDLCTPYFIAQYNKNHMGLPEELRDNVQIECYEAGHMMYVNMKSRKKLFDDLHEFYGKCEGYKEEAGS